MVNVQQEIDARRARAAVIAATGRITEFAGYWLVPSQTGGAKYRVALDADAAGERRWTCTCEDFADRGSLHPCKHIFAVEIVRARPAADAPVEPPAPRPTYKQDWTSHGAAQMNEKDHVVGLLHELAASTAELPRKAGRGRRRLRIADVLMSACMKVYIGWSGRRAMSEMRSLGRCGLLAKVPAFNSVSRYMEDPALTPILMRMARCAATPLASLGLRTDFAIDSTGINLRTFAPGFRAEKYGTPTPKVHGWLKLHACVHTQTHVITALVVTDGTSGDSPKLIRLVDETILSGLTIDRLSADKAYCSHANIQHIVEVGAEPLIPFRDGTGDGPTAPESYRRAFLHFQLAQTEFLEKYGQRQNVEATFSALKRVIGDSVRSRERVAQINEILVMVILHNLRRIIHAIYKLGLEHELPSLLHAPST
ncbi:MAG: transposase [Polyangiales bacterium]